jgi:hypothetical protein
VAFEITRGVTVLEAAPEPARPTAKAPEAVRPMAPPPVVKPAAVAAAQAVALVRIAALDGQAGPLSSLQQREAAFAVVSPRESPDLVWDPKSRDVLVGGDVIAYGAEHADLPAIIDRAAAVRAFKTMGSKAPQSIRVLPNDKLHRSGSRIEIEVAEVAGRSMVMLNIAGDGTVQMLYPIASDPPVLRTASYRFPVQVREPFGADQVVVITSEQRLNALEQVVRQLNRRRSPMQVLRMVERYGPPDARVGLVGLFTAR